MFSDVFVVVSRAAQNGGSSKASGGKTPPLGKRGRFLEFLVVFETWRLCSPEFFLGPVA